MLTRVVTRRNPALLTLVVLLAASIFGQSSISLEDGFKTLPNSELLR